MSSSFSLVTRWLIAAYLVVTPFSAVLAEDDETVFVFARHWQESVDNVPGSVNVISGDALQGSISGFDKYVSNVKIEDSSVQTRVVIRGGTGYDTGLQDPVGYYVDGVALPMGGTQLPQLFNLEQIEVFKGPQGSLYGRNSEAGVIKLQTLRPDWEPTFSASLQASVTDGANGKEPSNIVTLRGANELVQDQLAGSVALRYEDTKGPFLNRFDGDENGGSIKNWTLSSSLDAELAETTELRFRSLLSKEDAGKSQLRYSTGNNATDRFVTNNNTQTFDDNKSAIHSLTVDHQMDDLKLVSITGITNFRRDFQADLDTTPAPILPTLFKLDDDMLSQEFRLESSPSDDFRWLAGLYLYKQETKARFTIGGTMTLPRSTRVTNIDQKGVAGFGQVEFGMTDALDLTLGARVERVNKDGNQSYTTTGSANYAASIDDTMVLPKATLAYHLNSDAMLYASVSKGYLPGGFNYASAQNINSFTYKGETSLNTELGYKGRFLDQKLDFTAALFQVKTQDKQIVNLLPGFVQTISNAAETTSQGLELSVDYNVNSALTLYSQLGWMKAETDKYVTNVFQGGSFVENNQAGKELPLSPEFTYGLGFKYDAGQGVFGDLSVNGSGDYYFDSANTLKQSGYTRVDGEVGYQFDDSAVSLVASNIFNEKIISRAVSTPAGTVVEDTAPRYVGIKLSVNW